MLDYRSRSYVATNTSIMPESEGSMENLTGKQKVLRRFEADWQKLVCKLNKEAIAKGFSSWEEEERCLKEEHKQLRREADAQLEEEARETGRTIKDLCKARYGDQWMSTRASEASPQCDCDEHPFPMFCPKALINYKTQDYPQVMDFIGNQHPVRLDEIKLHPDNRSRRLGHDSLEHMWTRGSPEMAELPMWAKQDEFVRNLLVDQESASQSMSMEGIESTKSLNPSQSPGTPSSLGAQSQKHAQATLKAIQETPTKPRFQPQKSAKGRKKKSTPITTTWPTGITKILRSNAPLAARTRSHNLAKFYELGHDSRARPLRKP